MNNIKENHLVDECIVFREYSSVIEAEIIKSVLESGGVWSTINNEYMSSFYPTGVIDAQLIIKQSDLQLAEDLVKE